jgi:hypothetical protein
MSAPRPISLSQVSKTLANGLAADLFLCDVLAGLHLHLERKVDLERVVEIRDLRFSGF